MPMTEHGFQKLTYAEILEQQIVRAKDLFGQDIDTSEKSVIGKYIRLNVSDFAQQEEALEKIYQARYIDTAYGISLDRLAPFACITRNAAVAAILRVILTNTGETDVAIPMGTKLVNTDGTLYHITASVTVKAGGAVHARAECDLTGTIGNAIKNMAFYQTQIPNIIVSCPTLNAIAVSGKESETDAEFRARWKKALHGSGSGTSDAVSGAVSRIDGVQDVVLYENDTDEVMKIGIGETLNPHSFIVIVRGAEDQSAEIAKTIFEKKPLGIQASGGRGTWNIATEIVTDKAGIPHTIYFAYASAIKIKVYVTVSKENEPNFQLESSKEIFAEALQSFFESYKIGQTVFANTLYAPLVQTGAVSCIDKIELDNPAIQSPHAKTAKIVLGVEEYALFDSVEIVYMEEPDGE